MSKVVVEHYSQRKRLGEELEFETRQPKPKLNKSSKVKYCFYQLNFIPSAETEVK